MEGSHLASMFSGRWEDCLDHDSNGRVFLDPYSFQQILTMLRCRLFDLANSAARYEAIITPDKLHAYKRLVDYLALEGLCGAADKFSNAPSDACQLTYVSEGAFVTRSMAKGQRVTCVNPFNNKKCSCKRWSSNVTRTSILYQAGECNTAHLCRDCQGHPD